jgi:hypothetical protein
MAWKLWAATRLLLDRAQSERGGLERLTPLVERAAQDANQIVGDPAFRRDPARWAMGMETQAAIDSCWLGRDRRAQLGHAAQLLTRAAAIFEGMRDEMQKTSGQTEQRSALLCKSLDPTRARRIQASCAG